MKGNTINQVLHRLVHGGIAPEAWRMRVEITEPLLAMVTLTLTTASSIVASTRLAPTIEVDAAQDVRVGADWGRCRWTRPG